jgi:hypothetical protein
MRMPQIVAAVLLIGALAVPAPARAQGEGASIVGQVQDSSGAVIPGVTVEAASPALIERVRSAVTDDAGRYTIVNLRPGTYVVTFALPGFNTVRREGIVLAGAFAAQVNAQLAVGALEETVTVSGASPVVDVQNTRTQFVANRQILDALPARTTEDQAALVPGVISYNVTPGQVMPDFYTQRMGVHGSDTGDKHVYFDGMNVHQMLLGSGGQSTANGVNELAQTELVYDVGSQSAESPEGGIQMSAIPKEGGNQFNGTWRLFGSWPALQGDNLTDDLRAQGIRAVNKLDYNWENNVAIGGPIRENRLWWFGAFKLAQNNVLFANTFFPDGRQADSDGHVSPNGTVRLTYQATPRNKVAINYYNATTFTQRFDLGGGGSGGLVLTPEAAYSLAAPVNYSGIVKWTSPVTNRLFVDVGQSLAVTSYNWRYQPDIGPFDVQRFNSTTGVRTTATMNPIEYFSRLFNTAANVAYVTGSHSVKAGVNIQAGYDRRIINQHGDMQVLTLINVNGVPTSSSVNVRNSPTVSYQNLNAMVGLFAQDKWAYRRFTFTFGGRYDYLNASVPDQTSPAGRFVAARAFDDVSCVPCWSNWSARLGLAYDVFGNGRTAIKATVGKFVASQALGLAGSVNPLALLSDSRAWTDLDGNGSALDAQGNAQYNEIGASRVSNFGLGGGVTVIDPDLPRPTNWQESVSLEQQLWSGMSVTGTYYRRDFQNIQYTTNTLVDPFLDYTPFTITAPRDARLPGGGGEAITMYNINQNSLGVVNNVLTWSTANTRIYNGFEVSVNGRLPRGGFVFGGITTERTATNNCADLANSNPNNLRFCEQVPPFKAIYKASGSYPLVYGIQLSGSLQARPGLIYAANYTFNSAIAGVPLTGGGNLTVNLVDPATSYYDYVTQVDVRLARTFQFGRRRAQAFVDVFNVVNASTVLSGNHAFGTNWLLPQSIVNGRRVQIGARLDF